MARIFHTKRLSKGLSYWSIIIQATILLVAIYFTFIANNCFTWLGLIVSLFTPISIYTSIHNWLNDRKISKGILIEVDRIEGADSISTKELEVTRIAVFDNFEDEGNLYLFEIAGNSVLAWRDDAYYVNENLTKSKIEIYQSDKAHSIFGQKIIVSGDSVQLIRIPSELKWEMYDWLPQNNGETIEKDLMAFLDELKNKLQVSD